MTRKNTERETREPIWESVAEQDGEQARERRRNFFGLFESGGAEKGELKRHLGQVCDALCRSRYYDTLAVLLRGLGLDDDRILDCIRDQHIMRGQSLGSVWDALRMAGISPDAEAMIAALKEVDDSYRKKYEIQEEDYEQIPF